MAGADPRIGRRTSDADLAVILERLDDQDGALAEIKALATATNGRVRALEIDKAIREDREKQAAIAHAHAEAEAEIRRQRYGSEEARASQRSALRVAMMAAALGGGSSAIGYLFLVTLHLFGVHTV